MTEEEAQIKQENEELMDMFGSPGWAHFVARVDAIIEPLENLRNVQSEQDLWMKKGELRNLDWIKNFPDLVRMALDDL